MSDKVNKEIFNSVNENVKALEQLFPSVVKDGEVDFEALKQELGDFAEVGTEKYDFTWAGKSKAKAEAQRSLDGLTLKLKPGEGVNEDSTENIYIEGDNLKALKLLRNSYYGAIKMIYIDPPYNTGNDFVYKDNFAMSQDELDKLGNNLDEEGNRMSKNSGDSARYHTDWLNFMYPRLKVARDLLTDDGVIFISIDDNEQANLKKICDEVFGDNNFVSLLSVENNPKGRKNSKFISVSNEFCFIYAKNIQYAEFIENVPKNSLDLKEDEDGNFVHNSGKRVLVGENAFNKKITSFDNDKHYTVYFNKSNKKLSIEKEDSLENINQTFINQGYDRYCSYFGKAFVENTYTLKKFNELFNNNALEFKNGKIYEKNMSTTIRLKSMLINKEYEAIINGVKQKFVMDFKTTSAGTAFKTLFNSNEIYFTAPKNISYLKILLSLLNDKDFLVLDFFSGSATTAHAVMQLNAEDGGNRKYICVQIPENTAEDSEAYKAGYKNICEIGKERIRRAGAKIEASLKECGCSLRKINEIGKPYQINTLDEEGNVQSTTGFATDLFDSPKDVQKENEKIAKSVDVGFKVFKVADTNIKLFSNELENKEMSIEDFVGDNKEAIDFNAGYTDVDVCYELLLRHRGIPLSSKIEKLPIGDRTYIIADSIVVCLEQDITEEMIKKLADIDPQPAKYIFRDSSFGQDISLKENAMIELSALIKKNTDEKQKSYRVEFI